MAGCSIVLLTLIVLPILLFLLIAFLGILGGALVIAIVTLIAYIILKSKGVFQKYNKSDIWWQKLLAIAGEVVLIICFIGTLITSVIGVIILLKLRLFQ